MAQEIGTLLPIRLEEIEPLISTKAHEFLITESAKAINEAKGHNWIPVIVKQTGIESFQAIANIFILLAAQKAGIDEVWCIVADDSATTQKSSQLLSQELTPKVDLATATRDEIKLALDYLINRSVNPLAGVRLATALDKIDGVSRQSWKESLKEVVALKCGITTGKKFDIFKEVFYITPQTPPPPPPKVDLATATRNDIKLALDYLINHSVKPLTGVNLDAALDKIDNPYRQYWKEDLKEVTALKCGITAAKMNIFKEFFYTTPQPLPDDVTDRILLNTLTVTELKKIAEKRDITGFKKLKKPELIELLTIN
jgi:hypothetical protein